MTSPDELLRIAALAIRSNTSPADVLRQSRRAAVLAQAWIDLLGAEDGAIESDASVTTKMHGIVIAFVDGDADSAVEIGVREARVLAARLIRAAAQAEAAADKSKEGR